MPYFVSFLRDDNGGMKRAVAQAAGRPGVENWIAWAEALVLARSGRLHDARRLSRIAVNLAEQGGQRERAAMFEAGRGGWEAFFGNMTEARQRASKALVSSTGRDVQFAAAFALALSGESAHAQRLADDLGKRFPADTCVRFSFMPPLQGLLSLSAHEPGSRAGELQSRKALGSRGAQL